MRKSCFKAEIAGNTAITDNIRRLKEEINSIDAVLIGAGAGMSVSAGFTYTGQRFQDNFQDFIEEYQFQDMYSGGFYPFSTLEEHWAYWSRYIYINRYQAPPKQIYEELHSIIKEKDYFVITTNVDHCFQRAGFDKERLFYTQGDYGLWQCSRSCHLRTYDNEEQVLRMVQGQKDMRIPSELIPYCPKCGAPMSMNLRADSTFVEEEGWHRARARYEKYLEDHKAADLLLLELGCGMNTPGIIKFPFWELTKKYKTVHYVCINQGEALVPEDIQSRSICLNADIGEVIQLISRGEEKHDA